MGLIEEAPVSFASAEAVPQAGVLLGLALLGETHLVEEARAVYGRLKNGWYGLRSLLSTLIAMGSAANQTTGADQTSGSGEPGSSARPAAFGGSENDPA